jgi:hypothetical protein
MYRILTESKNVDLVKASLGDLGLDYTLYSLYSGDGMWRGQQENSLIIELDNITKDLAEKAAKLIKRLNRQEKVSLQEIAVTSRFV